MAQNDHHHQGGLTALLGALVFVFMFLFYLVAVNSGVTLDEKVSTPAPAGTPKFDLASVKEPWLPNEQVAAEGQKLYKQNCALCHGEKGDLVGGIPNARNLVEGKWTRGEGLINHFKVVTDGIAGTQMTGYKQLLKPVERWAILNFINTITQSKSKDKPEDVAKFATTAE